jgi:hypothetical protein
LTDLKLQRKLKTLKFFLYWLEIYGRKMRRRKRRERKKQRKSEEKKKVVCY